jgi:hypothetical protein
LISHAPASAATVVAIALEADSKDAVGLEEIALAKIDPMRIAGQIRSLRSKIRLSARPVGGHNGVAVALIAGNNSAVSAMPK